MGYSNNKYSSVANQSYTGTKFQTMKESTNVKKHRIDCSYKVYFKKNGCTMLLFKNLPLWRALHRKKVLMNTYEDWQGHFIVTK